MCDSRVSHARPTRDPWRPVPPAFCAAGVVLRRRADNTFSDRRVSAFSLVRLSLAARSEAVLRPRPPRLKPETRAERAGAAVGAGGWKHCGCETMGEKKTAKFFSRLSASLDALTDEGPERARALLSRVSQCPISVHASICVLTTTLLQRLGAGFPLSLVFGVWRVTMAHADSPAARPGACML